ncbi:15985_t:CDS:2 [Acaulospora morrowiae]|uniref:15985_t:CDS:1 n=1 Tax=Acaulospora morrowiae TaxID=94023 RepID=A0A9N9AR05_9GLOM|nr:15985_t:CDS:2 [Acaulospora morrowiae]
MGFIAPSRIEFFRYDDRSTPIPPDTPLQPLARETLAKLPLVVRCQTSDIIDDSNNRTCLVIYPLEKSKAEIIKDIYCNCFGENYQEVKNIVSYIARLLQVQADVLKKENGLDEDEKRCDKR